MRDFTGLLKEFIVRTLSGFIKDKDKRKHFRAKYMGIKKGKTHSPFIINEHYGKIYYPHYSKAAPQSSCAYELYNKDGLPVKTFFLRDVNHSNCPCNHQSKYFIFDRFNFGLDTHFYTHSSMLETMGNPLKKYGMFMEPESLVPEDYMIFDNNKGLEKDFDLIFTFSEKFLDKFDNARFFSFCARPWCSLKDENGKFPENFLELKTKNISILSSDKTMCHLHRYRLDLARKYKYSNIIDTYGTFDGGNPVNVAETLKNYRYSIIVENNIEAYWFTEKILNCFSMLTVPIYLGATKIDKFFNPDGIITITEKSDIDKVLKNCTEEDYISRLEAIKDNYYRALKYENPYDFLYEQYLKTE